MCSCPRVIWSLFAEKELYEVSRGYMKRYQRSFMVHGGCQSVHLNRGFFFLEGAVLIWIHYSKAPMAKLQECASARGKLLASRHKKHLLSLVLKMSSPKRKIIYKISTLQKTRAFCKSPIFQRIERASEGQISLSRLRRRGDLPNHVEGGGSQDLQSISNMQGSRAVQTSNYRRIASWAWLLGAIVFLWRLCLVLRRSLNNSQPSVPW